MIAHEGDAHGDRRAPSGASFEFVAHDAFVVGRSAAAQFRLPLKDKTLSRVHFLVEVNPPSCRLMDMASTNGTLVNGKQVTTIDLADGDTIRAGRTELKLWIGSDDPDPTETRLPGDPLSPLLVEPTVSVTPTNGLPALPRLLLETEIGRGGMGVVYRASTPSGEAVAVKTIAPAAVGTEGVVARFLREAAILRQLDHPGIVRFREIGHADGLIFFVMDLVSGDDADALVRRHGPLPVPRAVAMARTMLNALAFAHSRGFVHRDVKPKNLLVSEPGTRRESVKLADFGLAKLYLDSPLSGLSFTGQVAGTYGYMPPEQITQFREARPPADIYAAGATLYFLLTGRKVYDFPTSIEKQLLMILQDPPIPIQDRREEIPDVLAEVIHRALERQPDARFPDALSMWAELAPFAPAGR